MFLSKFYLNKEVHNISSWMPHYSLSFGLGLYLAENSLSFVKSENGVASQMYVNFHVYFI